MKLLKRHNEISNLSMNEIELKRWQQTHHDFNPIKKLLKFEKLKKTLINPNQAS